MSTINDLQTLLEDLRSESFRNQGAYNKVCEEFAKLTNAEACSIYLMKSGLDRLVMRGYYGRGNAFVDSEKTEHTYAPGKGVTGRVYSTGDPSSVKNASDVPSTPGHRGDIYRLQWGDDHICHSWEQFPIMNLNNRPLGVIKIENKLDSNCIPIESGGFEAKEISLLKLVADLIVPFILINQTRDYERKLGWTSDVYSVFSSDLVEQLRTVTEAPYPSDTISESIKSFCISVEEKKNSHFDYVQFVTDFIKDISTLFKISEETMKYCELLNEYENVLYQIPSYRGHYVHQFNVFLNGYVILKNLDDESLNVFYDSFNGKGDCFKNCTCNTERLNMILMSWFVIALFHDVAYPISKIEKWTDEIVSHFFLRDKKTIAERTAKKQPDIRIPDSSEGLFEKLAVNLRSEVQRDLIDITKESCKWLNQQETDILCRIHDMFFEKLSDSVITGIVLKRAFNEDKKNQWLVGASVSAIFLCDEENQKFLMAKMGRRFSWSEHPLAFLLAICDAAQELGRRKGDAVIIGKGSVIKQTLNVSGKKIEWELTYQAKPDFWDNKVAPMLNHFRDFWKDSRTLEVIIDYMTEDGDRIDSLHKGKTSRRPKQHKLP